MSDERIQIQIDDKIAPSIESKLETLATQSLYAHDNVERLKNALKGIDPRGLNNLTAAMSRAQKAINDAALSSSRLRTEEQKTSAATIQAAVAQQRLQTEATRTALAQQQLSTATARANIAQAQTATATANAAAAQSRAASAALRLEQAQSRAANAARSMEREAEALKRQLFPLYDAQAAYNGAVARADALLKAGAIDQSIYAAAVDRAKLALERATVSTNQFNVAQNRMGSAAKINRAHLTNLGFQLNDIGVSLASGQNPLVVLIQQGSQIAGIASQAGVGLGSLAKAAIGMLARFVPVAAVVGLVVAGIKSLNSEADKTANLKGYAQSLGATQEQIKRLNLDTITFGDSMRGLWKTIMEGTSIGPALSKTWQTIKEFFGFVLKGASVALTSVVALFQASFDTIVDAVKTFPQRFVRYIAETVNDSISYFEFLANAGIGATNKIIEALNKISSSKINPLETLKLDRIDTSQFKDSAKSLVDTFVESYVKNLDNNQKKVSKFIAEWQKNSAEAARARIFTALKGDRQEENRAAALAKINAQLDNEKNRLFELKPLREEQQRFDQIEENLLGRKIKLNAEEAASIRAKIHELEKSKTVQAEMDRIYEESVGTLRIYNDTQAAATILLAKNAISQEDANAAIFKAREAYLNSLNPLREYNRELDQNIELLAMLPRDREVAQQLQQVENQLLAKGKSLYDANTGALNANGKALLERLKAQQQMNEASEAEAAIWENTAGARQQMIRDLDAIAKLKAAKAITAGDATNQVGNLLPEGTLDGTQQQIQAEAELLDQRQQMIEAAHAKHLLSEEAYSGALAKVNADRFALEMSNAQRFFGGLAGLMSSGNQRLFKIGKAAALANAVISGTEAVINAMAIKPWYVGAALAVAQAVSSAQQIAAIRNAKPPTGFMRGGYTGNVGRSEVAGVVHGQEFVMNAGATARIGSENLEALQRGAASVQTTSNYGGVNVSIANYGTPKDFEVQRLSPEDVRIIARDEASKQISKDTPRLVSAQIAEPNSVVSKSLGKHTTAGRRRAQ